MDGPRPPDSGLLALWSPPRCRSTAFLRMMMERDDTAVVHEPFSNLAGQGHFDFGDRVARSETEVLDVLLEMAQRRLVFVKDTTDYRYGELLADPRLRTAVRNTFIVRDPAEAIASHYAISPELTVAEVGFEQCWELFQRVADGPLGPPVVIDAADLVAWPAEIVERYCAAVGIAFQPSALQWSQGFRPEWRHTSRWHLDVARTSGFEAPERTYAVQVANDARLAALYEHHLPFYRELHARRLRPRRTAPTSS